MSGNRIERRSLGYERKEEVNVTPQGIAIVGAAGTISNYHLEAQILSPRWNISGIHDIRSDEYGPLLEAYPELEETTIYDNLDSVLADPTTQAVLVATPSEVRHEIMKQVLAAGKHAIGEKPLVRNLNDFYELEQVAQAHGVTVECMYHSMFNDTVEWMAHQMYQTPDGFFHPEFGKLEHVRLLRADSFIQNGQVIPTHPREGGSIWDSKSNCDAELSRYGGTGFETTTARYVNTNFVDEGFPDVHSFSEGVLRVGGQVVGTFEEEITWLVENGYMADGKPIDTHEPELENAKDTWLYFDGGIVELQHVPQRVLVNSEQILDFSKIGEKDAGGRMMKEYVRGYEWYYNASRQIWPGSRGLTIATTQDMNRAEQMALANLG